MAVIKAGRLFLVMSQFGGYYPEIRAMEFYESIRRDSDLSVLQALAKHGEGFFHGIKFHPGFNEFKRKMDQAHEDKFLNEKALLTKIKMKQAASSFEDCANLLNGLK